MSGFGERFRRAGYAVPKPLIEVDGKPIIAHVIDLFPGENNFKFIVNREHLEEPSFTLRETIERYCPTAQILPIEPHKLGPVYAVSKVIDKIADDEPTIVNYCDFTNYWNYEDLKKFLRDTKCDGCVPAYRGFHPHMLGTTNYAFMREQNGWMLDIQEKQPFTDNRMEEFASTGTYYFRTGALLKKYIQRTLDEDLRTGDEYYVSLSYKPMVQDGLRVAIYEVEHFMQWGTPEDLQEYQQWSKLFRDLLESSPNRAEQDGTLLIPAAGAGSRFAQEGYTQPKPLIPVSGRPMVVQAASDLPALKDQVFVLRRDLAGLEEIMGGISEYFPRAKFTILAKLTEGQACTCLEGLSEVDPNAPVAVGTCDNGMIYDTDTFQALVNDPQTDVIVWVARGYAPALKKPTSYGWVQLAGSEIKKVSCKVPFSEPEKDGVILGAFYFKRAADMKRSIERLIARNGRVNNEFYMDSAIEDAIALGLRCRAMPVDHYICWGTPNELRTFNYWQSCFSKWPSHPYELEKDCRTSSSGGQRSVVAAKKYRASRMATTERCPPGQGKR